MTFTHLLKYVNIVGVIIVGKVQYALGGIGAQIIEPTIPIGDTAGLGLLSVLILLGHGRCGGGVVNT